MMKSGRKPDRRRVMRRRASSGRRTVADVADEVLEFLEAGRLRDVKAVADAVDLSEEKVEKILDFLTRTGFIRKGVQITDSGRRILMLPTEKYRHHL